MRSLLVPVLGLCAVVFSSVAKGDAAVPPGKKPAAQPLVKYTHYIVPEARGDEFYYGGHAKYFTPTKVEVGRLESDLLRALRRQDFKETHSGNPPWQRLDRYVLDYVGIIASGKRRIWVSAWIHDGNDYPIDQPVMAKGGGAGYWRITWDPATGTFSGYEQNGPE